MVLWAWERPEDMRFAAGKAEIAVQTGFVSIDGDAIRARGRRHPLEVGEPPSTAVVHVQIEPARPLRWTPLLRHNLAAAVLHYAQVVPARRVQVDFEVRASERQALLDLLADVRRGLPAGTIVSMTALASWCDTESWLKDAAVDEIVPMLFRMQRGAETIRRRLAAGDDFRNPRCRTALGIATDTPLPRAPTDRLVYVFAPQSWTASEFARVKEEVGRW
ncbi:hypothetical protein ACT009_06615 [Sphingomonas sp. Tas61C01]|uniref:hypothetical protein n=1 Tax=Sphingomonas sp. Tas61C01 TaxID=3458297 RepID=UPI00403E5677